MACAAVEPSTIQSESGPQLVFHSVENLILRAGSEKSVEVRSSQSSEAENKLLFGTKEKSVRLISHFEEFIAFLLSRNVPEIRSVFMGQEGKLLRIFIVVEEYDFEVNERIYDQEECVMDAFSYLDFDFHITCHHSMSDPSLEKVL